MTMIPMPPVHSAAAIFPLMPEAELAALAEHIKLHGLQHKIVIRHGLLLDGRNRWLACGRAGVVPETITRDDIKDPYAFVVGENLRHRHLTPSQAAMLGGELSRMFEEEARGRMALGGKAAGGDAQALANLQSAPATRANERAAAMVASSPRSVGSARLVLKSGVPALAAAVRSGAVAVSVAAEVARLPRPALEELLTKTGKELEDGVIKAARTLRKERKAVRKPKDAYMSAGGFMRPLLPLLGQRAHIIECCAGDGDLVGPLRAAGHRVFTVDVDPARAVDAHADMATAEGWARMPPAEWVVSNLPFKEAIEILPRAVAHASIGVAVILRLTFLEPTTDRAKWLAEHPLTKQIVLPRYSFTGDGSTDSVTCAIMIWERGKEPAIFIPLPDADGMPGDCFFCAGSFHKYEQWYPASDGVEAKRCELCGGTAKALKDVATATAAPTTREEPAAAPAPVGNPPAAGLPTATAYPSDELIERVARIWLDEMSAPNSRVDDEDRIAVRGILTNDTIEMEGWTEEAIEVVRATAVTEQAAIDERDGACFECHAKPGEVHGDCADQGITVKAAKGKQRPDGTTITPPAAPQKKAAKAKKAAEKPTRIDDPKLIARINGAYSADTIADKGNTRVPVEIDGRSWISLSGISTGQSGQVELWRLVPLSEWEARTYTVTEIHETWNHRESKRGDSTGLLVNVKKKAFVLDGTRRVYAWGPEEL